MSAPAESVTPGPDSGRIQRRFESITNSGRGGLVAYVTAGYPDADSFMELFRGLPGAGADIIEIGMPFTDPMADGPAIQVSNLQALKNGQTLAKTLDMVGEFRKEDADTPIVLMGYYNPIYSYGVDRFLEKCREVGVDGLIVVDLPPEEDRELCIPALEAGVNFIRLATPTTDDKRLPKVLSNASGFVYYVSIAGITGTKDVEAAPVAEAVARLKQHTDLPIAVGFGIKTPEQAHEIASVADAAVVGSAIIRKLTDTLDEDGRPAANSISDTLAYVRSLADGVGRVSRGTTRTGAA